MDIKNFIERIRRVLLVSSKPDKEEFKQSMKITGLGIILVGLVGFVIFLIAMLIGGL
ncbi:MAG: protein translocase SEC61 complex subunit gamma [Candidatus Aenigmatarchaeota archaeon]